MGAKNGRINLGGETPAEYLTRVMLQRGFEPSRVYNAHFIEYSKTYADQHGRVARAVVQFERPSTNGIGVGAGEVRLSGFTVLVQAHVDASVEAVVERAPPVMQDDLLACVDAFAGGAQVGTQVAVERCVGCRMPVSEFFVLQGRVLCRACKEG